MIQKNCILRWRRDAEAGEKNENFCPIRYVQAGLLFLLLIVMNAMRSNLSVAIVAIRDPLINRNSNQPTYDWDNASTILSSYFWGYVLTQIPSGLLANKYGRKWILVVCMTLSSLFCFLVPPLARLGSWAVIACQICQGLAQGSFIPLIQQMLSEWVPLPERARLCSFVSTGATLGILMGMSATGWICTSKVGWPCSFYLLGVLAVMWSILFAIYGFDSPAKHPSISFKEKQYIAGTSETCDEKKAMPTPFGAIFKSLPFWAVMFSHCVANWGYFTFLTEAPIYMSKVLHFSLEENGMLSATPYLVSWLTSTIISFPVDYVINKKILSITTSRKIANSLGLYTSAIVLVVMAFCVNSHEDSLLAVVLLNLGVGLRGLVFSGYNINHMDLAPNHAGTMMSLTNTIANVMSLLGPLFVQYIVVDEANADQWKIVFLITAGWYVVGNTFYIFFASGEIQSWNYPQGEETETTKNNTKV